MPERGFGSHQPRAKPWGKTKGNGPRPAPLLSCLQQVAESIRFGYPYPIFP